MSCIRCEDPEGSSYCYECSESILDRIECTLKEIGSIDTEEIIYSINKEFDLYIFLANGSKGETSFAKKTWRVRRRVKEYLRGGPRSTQEIFQYLNNATKPGKYGPRKRWKHGTTMQSLTNALGFEKDIIHLDETRIEGSRYGSYSSFVWVLKQQITIVPMIHSMMMRDERFEKWGEEWHLAAEEENIISA